MLLMGFFRVNHPHITVSPLSAQGFLCKFAVTSVLDHHLVGLFYEFDEFFSLRKTFVLKEASAGFLFSFRKPLVQITIRHFQGDFQHAPVLLPMIAVVLATHLQMERNIASQNFPVV